MSWVSSLPGGVGNKKGGKAGQTLVPDIRSKRAEQVPQNGADAEWCAGRIPGALEEGVLSAQAGQPVFLIGATGGAAALAIDLLEG